MNIEEKKKIAEASRLYRCKNRMSQSELAELAGMSQVSLSYLECHNFRFVSEKLIKSVQRVINKRKRR